MEINKKIIELRKLNNMTQDNLAEALGVSRQSISKWENGECLPEINKLKAMAELFNVSIDYLVNGSIAKEASDTEKGAFSSAYLSLLISSIVSIIVAIAMIVYSFSVKIDYRTPHSGYLGFLETWSAEATIVKMVIIIALGVFSFCIYKLVKLEKNKHLCFPKIK